MADCCRTIIRRENVKTFVRKKDTRIVQVGTPGPQGIQGVPGEDGSSGDLSTAVLLAGRSGGQIINGDLDSAGNLTLVSTAHATKGKILFGNSAYDEVNNRLGIGETTPLAKLHIDTGGGIGQIIKGDVSQVENLFEIRDYLENTIILFSPTGYIGLKANVASTSGIGVDIASTTKSILFTASGNRITYSNFYGHQFKTWDGSGYNLALELKGNTTQDLIYSGNGSVGIGDTTPASKLTVAGDVESTGNGNGIILEDTVTSARWRITIASGVVTPTLV